MKTAYIFTGQGFQYEGMLKELPECPITENMLDIASGILKEDVLKLDSKEALWNNRNVQLSIYISEVILGSLQLKSFIPDYVAGHSIGAFSAATVSGALEFTDGLQLVSLRGKAMEESYASGYGMMSVTGLTLEVLKLSLTEFKENEEVKKAINGDITQIYIANINTKDQIVLSGFLDTLKQMENYLKYKYPVKTQFLRVKVPSHCELMVPVTDLLSRKIEGIFLKQSHIPYIMNISARRTKQAEIIKKDLIYGVSKPVLWYDILSILYELETRRFLEVSQGNVLTEIGMKCYEDASWKKMSW